MAWSPPPAGRTGVGSSPTLQSPYARSRSGASNPASANPGMPLAGLWPLGCVAKRIGQPFHEDPWDFYHVGLCRRPVKSLFLGPQLLSHQAAGRTASMFSLLAIWWLAKRVTTENRPNSAGAVLRSAFSDQCRWVSKPRR